MSDFRAFRIDRQESKIVSGLTQMSLDELTPGDVLIKVEYSTVNYKDALAATGRGQILRRFPLNGGIDLAGTVVESNNPEFSSGDNVLVTGSGLSEDLDGGYAEYARVPSEAVIPVPESLGLYESMQIGTAGFTAALAIHRMEQNGQTPDKGPIIVTGATGGVGSLAIDMLSGRGYEVFAVTGKAEESDYLKSIGASKILIRQNIDFGKRPLEKAEWAGAIDNLGGEVLSWLLKTTGHTGNVASIGLAASHKLESTVLPFILRGVCLLGINSPDTYRDLRMIAWGRIGADLYPKNLNKIATNTTTLEKLSTVFDDFIEGRVVGRTVVKIN